MSFSIVLPYFLRHSLAMNLSLSFLAGLNDRPSSSHNLPILCHNSRASGMHNYCLVLLKYWVFELRTSCFYSKHSLTHLTSQRLIHYFVFHNTKEVHSPVTLQEEILWIRVLHFTLCCILVFDKKTCALKK